MERAREVFSALLAARSQKLPPYDRVQTLEYPIPKNVQRGSVEHAIFLFCSCHYMRGKINSNTALEFLAELHTQEPWLFDARGIIASASSSASELLTSEVAISLKKSGLGFNSEQVSIHWIRNMQKLRELWAGNPLQIFHESQGDYDVLCSHLIRKGKAESAKGFYGFREKMVSMLAYFYVQAGMVKPFVYPVPVDFHILRMLVSHEILSVEDLRPGARLDATKLSKVARVVTLDYCRETGIDPHDLSDVLWHKSRESCVEHPGNSSTFGKYKGRRTSIKKANVTWRISQQRKFDRTCGQCSVKGTCRWNIPSAPYYVQGVIEVRGERADSPQFFLRV